MHKNLLVRIILSIGLIIHNLSIHAFFWSILKQTYRHINVNLQSYLQNSSFPDCRYFDRNGDGVLDARELKVLFKRMFGEDYDDETVEELLRQADTDGDGVLSIDGQ